MVTLIIIPIGLIVRLIIYCVVACRICCKKKENTLEEGILSEDSETESVHTPNKLYGAT